ACSRTLPARSQSYGRIHRGTISECPAAPLRPSTGMGCLGTRAHPEGFRDFFEPRRWWSASYSVGAFPTLTSISSKDEDNETTSRAEPGQVGRASAREGCVSLSRAAGRAGSAGPGFRRSRNGFNDEYDEFHDESNACSVDSRDGHGEFDDDDGELD